MIDYTALAQVTIGKGKQLKAKYGYDPKTTRQMFVDANAGKSVLANLAQKREVCEMGIPGFFPTPRNLVRYMIQLAELQAYSQIILEPSAGTGNIADELAKYPQHMLHVCELNSRLRDILTQHGHKLVGTDFLEYEPERLYSDGSVMFNGYDRILMNPPFEKHADTLHVQHAYTMLAPGGILVAIMSEHSFFANHKQDQAFREWLGDSWSECLPADMFKVSERPTGVQTRLVVKRK